MEVQPEPYMALDRRVLFITYAIASYVYRWIVTYSILYFMYSFLKPYKLGVISAFMALFAAGSMAGWPLYRLGKNLYKRGRVPDMKKPRVIACCVVVAVLVAFFFLVPLPVSRVRSIAVVQVIPDFLIHVYVPEAAVLEKIYVEDGQTVEKDTPLAELRSREVDAALLEAQTQLRIRKEQLQAAADQERKTQDPQEKARLQDMQVQLEGERNKYATEVEGRQKKKDELTLRAPMAGVIMGCPRVNSLGKLWEEKELETPFCSIGDPTKLRVTLPVVPHDHALLAQDKRDLQESLKNHTAYPVPWLGVLVTDRGIFPMNDPQDDLGVTIRVQGRESLTWKGKLEPLPEQEAKEVPAGLTHKGGGPLAIKPGSPPGHYAPQGQWYLVSADLNDPDSSIQTGVLAQAKIHCRWRSCAWWVYRTIASTFDLRLI